MEEKKLKINIPEGYEIDRENSTFEEIVFKKVKDLFSKLPKTWEEYCKRTQGYISYYGDPTDDDTHETKFSKFYNEFSTKERVKQYVALGRLIQLRDYWVGNQKSDSHGFVTTIYNFEGEIRSASIPKERGSNYFLTFPTREMAQKFVECFKDLIKEARPLI